MEKNIEAFNNLIVNGLFTVNLVYSENFFISGIDIEKLNYNVLKQTLTINNNDCSLITVGAKDLKSTEINNNASMFVDQKCINAKKFTCRVSKESKISIGLNRTKKLKVKLEGDSKFFGQYFKADCTEVVIKKGGTAIVNCDGELYSDIKGSGSISNYGEAIRNFSRSVS